MPYYETPSELASAVADLCGVYGAHDGERCNAVGGDLRHVCRICFETVLAERIRESVANERKVRAAEATRLEGGGE